jgi:hypothetical protein
LSFRESLQEAIMSDTKATITHWPSAYWHQGALEPGPGTFNVSGAKPNLTYKVTVGEVEFSGTTDENGNAVLHPVIGIKEFSCFEKEFTEVNPKEQINWRRILDQALVDIEKVCCKDALAALPWLSGWLMISAREEFGDDWDD